MSYLAYELVILAVLALFALWGMHRGLVLTLCSLLAVLVAFVGSILLSNLLAPAVAGCIQPIVSPAVTAAVESALPEEVFEAELPVEELLRLLKEADLPMGLDQFLSDLQEDEALIPSADSLVESLSSALSAKLASAIAWIGLFLILFVLILILWHLLGRTLDLVARLPGLHLLNRLGGFVLGAVRGVLLLFVCAWVIRRLFSGLIPAEAVEQSSLLRFFLTVNPLDYLAKL